MKKHKGFVSNSSSQSFTCSICGTVHYEDDTDIIMCDNRHKFPVRCLRWEPKDFLFYNRKQVVKHIADKMLSLNKKDFIEVIEKIMLINHLDLDFTVDTTLPYPAAFCPTCYEQNLNRNEERPSDDYTQRIC